MSESIEQLKLQQKSETKAAFELKNVHEISPILENYQVSGPLKPSVVEEKIDHESLLCIHYNILGWYAGFHEQANQQMSRSIYDAANNKFALEDLNLDYFHALHISNYQACVERALEMGVKDGLLELIQNKIEINKNIIDKVYAETAARIKQYYEVFITKVKPALMDKLYKKDIFDPSQMLDTLGMALKNVTIKDSKIADLAKQIDEKSKKGEDEVKDFLMQFSTVNRNYRLEDGWLARREAVIAALKRDAGPNLDSTVFSLNEVTIHQYYDIYAAFKDTHTIVGFNPFKSPNEKGQYTPLSEYPYHIYEGKGPDGLGMTNLLLIPNKKFEIVPELVKLRWISEKPDVSEELSPPLALKHQRNTVLEVPVRDKMSGELLFLLSTHFTPCPAGIAFSAEFLAKEIKELELKHDCPVIALGDMNFYAGSNPKEKLTYEQTRQAYSILLKHGLSDSCATSQARYHATWLDQNTYMGFPYDPMSVLFNEKDELKSHLDRVIQTGGVHFLPTEVFFKDPVAITKDGKLIPLDEESQIKEATLKKNNASDHMLIGVRFSLKELYDKLEKDRIKRRTQETQCQPQVKKLTSP